MYHLRNRRKTYLTAPVPRRKRTKNLRKPRIIPSDVLMEIFKGLPSKDLMAFRCVSKLWNLVIRDPVFAQMHYRISLTRPSATTTILMGCRRPGRKLYFFEITPERKAFHKLTIENEFLDSINTFVTEIVNGLVCLYRFGKVMVCNISTREIISLPSQQINCYDLHPVYSLAYDPLNNEYKVLCICYRYGFCRCTVFTLGQSTEWRQVIDCLPWGLVPKGFNSVLNRDVVYHDGALHWLAESYYSQKYKLVSFDVREETFRFIDVPYVFVWGVGLQLVRIGGRLVVFGYGSHLLILEDRKNQVWVVKRNIHSLALFSPIGSIANRLIYRSASNTLFEFDLNNGEDSNFVVSGEGKDVLEKSIGSLSYPAKYSICETIENIYPLRQN